MPSLALLQDTLKESDKKSSSSPYKDISIPLSERLSGKFTQLQEPDIAQNQTIPKQDQRSNIVDTIIGKINRSEMDKQLKSFPEKFMKQAAIGPLLSSYSAAGKIIPSLESTASKMVPESVKSVIEKLSPEIQSLLSYGGKTATGTGIGMAMSEKPTENIETNVATSALLNALPFGIKQIGAAAERMIPEKFARKTAETIHELGKNVKEMYQKYYQPILKKFGPQVIKEQGISSAYDKFQNLLNPATKKAYDIFFEKPTFENAHLLVKQSGQDIGNLSSGKMAKAINIPKIQAHKELRDTTLKSMKNHLPKEEVLNFEKGSDIFKAENVPLITGSLMQEINKGKFKNVSLNALQKALGKLDLEERGKLSKERLKEIGLEEEHPIHKIREALQNKALQGKAYSTLGPAALGSLMGFLGGESIPGMGPIGAALGGGLAAGGGSALMNKLLGASPLSLAQNPAVVKAMEKAHPYYDIISKILSQQIRKGFGG